MTVDLLIIGAAAIAAVAAAAQGDRLSMALMLVVFFWTVVRVVREGSDRHADPGGPRTGVPTKPPRRFSVRQSSSVWTSTRGWRRRSITDGPEERRQAPRIPGQAEPATVTPEAISAYLEGEAKESARIERQVCPECLYAAGVHDESCSRFAQVAGR